MTAVLRWARPAAVAGDSAGGHLATMACLRLRDEGDAYARRLARAGVHVTHRQEPGLEHGFIQNMDLTSAEAAAAHERLFEDIRTLTRRSR
ncbi:alpha/beta hydrolase [Nonomuraea sp. NPDC003707]